MRQNILKGEALNEYWLPRTSARDLIGAQPLNFIKHLRISIDF